MHTCEGHTCSVLRLMTTNYERQTGMRNDMKEAGPVITPMCVRCGAEYSALRRKAGYTMCLGCGESEARRVRHTVAPMHKSNYVLITDRRDLAGLNNKGGLVR